MSIHIGVKLVKAEPMTRGEYNAYRGWTVPADENPADAGFLVEYLDGGQANMPDREGYVSWSPADVFLNAYRPTIGLTFGLALEALKQGKKVARAGWNGKGMWLKVFNSAWLPDAVVEKCMDLSAADCPTQMSFIAMRTAQNGLIPWLASQTDMLAEDWQIVE